MFLYGKNSVTERLKADPASIRKIFLEAGFAEAGIEKLIKNKRICVKRVSARELKRVKNADSLQGIVAQVDEFKYAHFEDLIYKQAGPKLSFIFLDRIFDPQNLGAIIRTAACFGNFAVVIPKHKACAVTEAVLRVACGGENFTPVALVSNLTNTLLEAKKRGWWAVGAVTSRGKSLNETSLPQPLCLVLGSEGKGLRYGLEKHLDLKVHIPMREPLSFNVTAAAAVFCYEISKQLLLSR